MKIIKLQSNDGLNDFSSARNRANLIAAEELGDHISLVFYNNDLKLVSNHGVRCGVTEAEDCGAGSYAKAFDADLEVRIDDRYNFYFRQVQDYLSTEGKGPRLQYDDSINGVF